MSERICWSPECFNPATLLVTDFRHPKDPIDSCDNHLSEFIRDGAPYQVERINQ